MSEAPVEQMGEPLRFGIAMPVFSVTPDDAFRAAEQAEEADLDGVFTYDHLWPMGRPGRPAISAYPLLGALTTRTSAIGLGTLVSRVGLASEEYLLGELLSIDAFSGGRLIAGIGTGDHKNASENEAYGIDFASASERRRQLERIAQVLVGRRIPTWIGAGASETNAIARRLSCVLNYWGAPADRVADAARLGPVTWAGNLPRDADLAARMFRELADAGAGWIVVHWPGTATPVLAAIRAAGLEREQRGPLPR